MSDEEFDRALGEAIDEIYATALDSEGRAIIGRNAFHRPRVERWRCSTCWPHLQGRG